MIKPRRYNQNIDITPLASLAARLCSRALELGVELAGAEFTVAGEPLTAARRAAIGKVGARADPRYSISECGPIGYGCLAPDVPDDMHVLTAGHAVIQPAPAPADDRHDEQAAARERPARVSLVAERAGDPRGPHRGAPRIPPAGDVLRRRGARERLPREGPGRGRRLPARI